MTRGYWFDDFRWAAVKGAGLVPLTVAAKLQPNMVYLRPSIKQALDCVLNGETPQDLSDCAGIGLETAWSYTWSACQHLTQTEARYVASNIIDDDLWSLLERMYEDGDSRLGASLTELMDYAVEEVDDFSSSDCPFGELKVARLLLRKVYG